MILPIQGTDDDAFFTLYIEVITARYLSNMPHNYWTPTTTYQYGRPESQILGKIVDITGDIDRTVTLLLEIKEHVGPNIERFSIA